MEFYTSTPTADFPESKASYNPGSRLEMIKLKSHFHWNNMKSTFWTEENNPGDYQKKHNKIIKETGYLEAASRRQKLISAKIYKSSRDPPNVNKNTFQPLTIYQPSIPWSESQDFQTSSSA